MNPLLAILIPGAAAAIVYGLNFLRTVFFPSKRNRYVSR
jgi:hypothetical protein